MNDEQMEKLREALTELLPGVRFELGGKNRGYFLRAKLSIPAPIPNLYCVGEALLKLLGNTITDCTMYYFEFRKVGDSFCIEASFRHKSNELIGLGDEHDLLR